MTMGRPVLWESSSEIENIIDEYFETTPPEEITLSGLCIALQTNKQTIANYQEKSEFKQLLEMAKLKIENAYEKSLRKYGRSGDIFALKNFGWSDKQEVELIATVNQDNEAVKSVLEKHGITTKD
jgi:hypothetical protein